MRRATTYRSFRGELLPRTPLQPLTNHPAFSARRPVDVLPLKVHADELVRPPTIPRSAINRNTDKAAEDDITKDPRIDVAPDAGLDGLVSV